MGGYFEAVGQPGDDNNTLCAGNGLVGDCSGTVGAARLIGANVIAGVNTPPTLNVVATPAGSTSYTYKCTATTANGETTPITLTIGNGPATLSGSTYNNVRCPAVPGATGIKVYRTAGGPSTGLIKTLTNITASDNSSVSFNDTGLAGDGTSPPTANTTGVATVYGPINATSATFNDGSGLGGGFNGTEGAAPSPAAGTDNVWADSTAHRLKMNNNNTGGSMFVGIATPATSAHVAVFAANGVDITDGGASHLTLSNGRATLVAGTVTVNDANATATRVYSLTNCGVGGTQGMLSVGTVTSGVSFVINSSSNVDTSTVCWSIQ
jgi:hypothetical protein